MRKSRSAKPFFYEGGKEGFLLIHGFTGSPWEMRYLGGRLNEQGYTVYAPLLRGHGTSPEEMIKTRWVDWYESVEEGFEKLKGSCERVYVAGLSMGGVLALHLAAHNPVDAVISLSAAFLLDDPKLMLLPLARQFPINLIYRYEKEVGRDIRDPAARKEMICYAKTPVPCIVSLVELIEHVKLDLREVRVPALIIHALNDHLVPYKNSQFVYERIRSPIRKKVTLMRSYHVITVDVEKEKVAESILDFVKPLPERKK